MSVITALAGDTDPQNLIEKCNNTKSEIDGSIEAWKARVSAENERRKARESSVVNEGVSHDDRSHDTGHSYSESGGEAGGSSYSADDPYSDSNDDSTDVAEPAEGESQFSGRE